MPGNEQGNNSGGAEARRERVVSLIALGATAVGVFTCLWMFFLWLRHPQTIKPSTAVVGAAILLIGLTGYTLSRAGRVTMAAWVTLLTAVAIAAYSVAMRGITSVNVIIFAPTVALAGMLVGSRAAAVVVGVDALIAVALGLAQGAGWQPPLGQASVSMGVLVVIGSLAFLLLVNGLSWRLMEQGLALAEAQTERLRVAHEAQRRLAAELKVHSQRQAQLLVTLRELGTAIIPVSKGIIILPLVGHVDAERLAHIRSTLMSGIARYRATVVLLEMTGLRELDGEIALGMLALSGAARLLGAELVAVGIQPRVAHVMIELDADTDRLTARPDLETAIVYALARRQGLTPADSVTPVVSGGNGVTILPQV